jgi:surface antigen
MPNVFHVIDHVIDVTKDVNVTKLLRLTPKTKTHKINRMKTNKPSVAPGRYHRRVLVLALLGVSVIGLIAAPMVYADSSLQEQINQLNQDNQSKQSNKDQLGAQAASYQEQINQLAAQIANLQAQIQANQVQHDQTVAKIAQAEADLAHKRQLLSDTLKSMYVGGETSNLEMLATSKNLNDFVDQQQYKNSVQAKIQEVLDSIKAVQAQLDIEKTNLERIIADQQNMQTKVAAQQVEQSRLLSLNQQQQADLNSQMQANSAKISDLRKQQALENARLAGGKIPPGQKGGGGYPGVWAFAAQDTLIDSWGMYNRECVSYTAYRVAASGRYMPYWGGVGNANQWDDNARAAGIPVDNNPKPGDVAISNSGYYGHAMYVEDVAADGSINISDYNQQYDGLYRNYWVTGATVAARGLVFIHF